MPQPTLPLIDIDILFSDFAQLERLGITYGYGIKAPARYHGASIKMRDVTPRVIRDTTGEIDCSGYALWGLTRASSGQMHLADGSQNQREQFEAWAAQGLVREVDYRQSAQFVTQKRLYINFIKPHANGCGDVGHVWLTAQYDDGNNGTKMGTLESHGGGGCVSRAWNYPVLLREHFSSYELATVQGAAK